MFELIWESLLDATIDSLKLLPFLYLVYLLMEYIEHHAEEKMERLIAHSGRFGPMYGGTLGLIPQCGMAAVGANLYSARLISLGTLLALFLSTSDEMLPIMLAAQAPARMILAILGCKLVVALLVGFGADLLLKKRPAPQISSFCQDEDCHCHEQSIWRAALNHTLKVLLFIFLVSLAINLLLSLGGEAALTHIGFSSPVLSPLLAALVGLIPNCASSVALTNLYLSGALADGAMLSGLLANCGIGLLVLFRANADKRNSLRITLSLYAVSVVFGWLITIMGVHFM